jgi:hypothetical protein
MLIQKIMKAIEYEQLKIDIFSDEVIFLLWDGELPIVYDIKDKTIAVSTEYANGSIDLTSEDVEILSNVMKILEEHKEEIASWFE